MPVTSPLASPGEDEGCALPLLLCTGHSLLQSQAGDLSVQQRICLMASRVTQNK